MGAEDNVQPICQLFDGRECHSHYPSAAAGKVLPVPWLSSRSLSLRPTRRRVLGACCAVAVGLSLASCTVEETSPKVSGAMDRVFGPRPDSAVMALAHLARTDSQAAPDGSFAALRAAQADSLVAEAARLCGTFPDGQAPQSCDLTQEQNTEQDAQASASPEAADAARPDQALRVTADALVRVPEQSRGLVATQAVELAGYLLDTAKKEPSEDPLSEYTFGLLDSSQATAVLDADSAAVADMLSREYALEYGLTQAQAFIDSSQAGALRRTVAAHLACIGMLNELSAHAGSTTSATPTPVSPPPDTCLARSPNPLTRRLRQPLSLRPPSRPLPRGRPARRAPTAPSGSSLLP